MIASFENHTILKDFVVGETKQKGRNVYVKEKVLRLAPFFSFPLVSPHGPHPRRRATRELMGVKIFVPLSKKLSHSPRSEDGRAVRVFEHLAYDLLAPNVTFIQSSSFCFIFVLWVP